MENCSGIPSIFVLLLGHNHNCCPLNYWEIFREEAIQGEYLLHILINPCLHIFHSCPKSHRARFLSYLTKLTECVKLCWKIGIVGQTDGGQRGDDLWIGRERFSGK